MARPPTRAWRALLRSRSINPRKRRRGWLQLLRLWRASHLALLRPALRLAMCSCKHCRLSAQSLWARFRARARLPASDRTGASHARPRGWRRFPRRCCDRFGEVLVLVRRLGRGGPRPATTRGGGASATPSCTTYRRTFREPRTFAPGLGQPVLQSSCGLALPRLGVRAIFPSRPLRRAHMDWGGARRERRRDPRRAGTTSVGHLPEGAHVVLLRGQS